MKNRLGETDRLFQAIIHRSYLFKKEMSTKTKHTKPHAGCLLITCTT